MDQMVIKIGHIPLARLVEVGRVTTSVFTSVLFVAFFAWRDVVTVLA